MNYTDLELARSVRQGNDIYLVDVTSSVLRRIMAIGDLLSVYAETPHEPSPNTLSSAGLLIENEARELRKLVSQWHNAKDFEARKDNLHHMADVETETRKTVYQNKKRTFWYLKYDDGRVDILSDDEARQLYEENGLEWIGPKGSL